MFTEPLPAFLSSEPGHVDILHAKSGNVMFNLATEETSSSTYRSSTPS